MDTLRMNLLPLGHLDCQYFRIVAGADEQTMYESPVSATLIRHPSLGNILYDTGNSPFNRWEYGEHINKIYPVGRFVSIQEALASQGLTCADIDMIIMSHLHFDHAGGLKYFVGTRAIQNVVVAEAELMNACRSVLTAEEHSAYVKSLFDVEGIVYKTIQDTVELSPDLTLFVQKSHTPGVIGLIIKTRSMGNVILTSDTVYTQESWDKALPPGGHINKTTDEFFANLERLKRMQKEYGAVMLFGHDSAQIREWSQRGGIE